MQPERIHLLKYMYYSFRHTQPFLFLDELTRSILPLVVLPLLTVYSSFNFVLRCFMVLVSQIVIAWTILFIRYNKNQYICTILPFDSVTIYSRTMCIWSINFAKDAAPPFLPQSKIYLHLHPFLLPLFFC